MARGCPSLNILLLGLVFCFWQCSRKIRHRNIYTGKGMIVNRRVFTLAGVAIGLSACSNLPLSPTQHSAVTPTGLPADLRPVPNSGYSAWVSSYRERVMTKGISESTLNSAFRSAGYLPGVIDRDRNQAEFKRSLEDYLSIAASDERISKGRLAFKRHQLTLRALQNTYGVDAEIICAIWGLESFYGERRGNVPTISATSTLAYDGRRGSFFEKQLTAALEILQAGDITVGGMIGSWAGAMGHTQFIPTSYQAFAVDFTGDGRRDIWSDDPSDALASTAAYLQLNGWSRGLRWGSEIGTRASNGKAIQPQEGGPRFSISNNFNVLKKYNNSDAYAIGVGHLADRIAGGGPLQGTFPPDEFGFTKKDRIALQERLTNKGFDTGGVDGVIGTQTLEAVGAYQQSISQPSTGIPSRALLQSLS